MRIEGKTLKCDRYLCPGCQEYELKDVIKAAGLSMLNPGDPEPDNAIWDKLDASCGIQTRELVQRAMRFGDYCFTYPLLHIDYVPESIVEDMERSGATIDDLRHCIVMRWGLPSPCGILQLRRFKYRIAIDDTVPWRKLRAETRDYCRGEGKPEPKGDDLLSCMKKTARHKHTNYDALRKFFGERGRLESRGVAAIRLAFDEELEKVYLPLKGF